METGRSSPVSSACSRVGSIPRPSPSELTISVTTRPHPPWRLTRRRNAESVMPAIGATANGDARSTEPIFMDTGSVGFHVRRVDFDAHGLSDEIDRQHETRLERVLAHQAADHAAQRSVHDFGEEDRTPEVLLNEIIWRSVMGPNVPMPPPRRSAF